MRESNFQFTSPVLEIMNFQFQPIEESGEKTITFANKFDTKVQPIDGNTAHVTLSYTVVARPGEELPFMLEAAIGANFRWDAEIEKEQSERLLAHNAPALLLGYLRPIVSQITTAAKMPIDIPFMNFA